MTFDADDLPGWTNPWATILRLGDRTATTHERLTPEQAIENHKLWHRNYNRTEKRKAYKKAWYLARKLKAG